MTHPVANLPEGTRLTRVVWVDNANIARAKAFHTGALEQFATRGVGIATAQMGIHAHADSIAPESGLTPAGEVRLVPDWTTCVALPHAPGHARVMGDMRLNGHDWALCPRGFLRRMVADAARLGITFSTSLETEFHLVKPAPGGGYGPAGPGLFASTLALDTLRTVMDELVDSLVGQGLPVELAHTESGPGQVEISFHHTHPLVAADRQVALRETAHAVALKHGLMATFMPKPFADSAGSGCHAHLSLWRDGKNLLPDPNGSGGLSRVGRSFIAGLLDHLPGLCALLNPTTNSYRRLVPSSWAGAHGAWGVENRETAIRVLGGSHGSTHFELKTGDCSANPYLALGMILAAGMDGVERQYESGNAVEGDPAGLTPEERTRLGIRSLPVTLGEAIDHLRADTVLLGALGDGLAKAFLAVRTSEWRHMREFSLADETRLLLQHY